MTRAHPTRMVLLTAASLALGLGLAAFLLTRDRPAPPPRPRPGEGFRESVEESGIGFRMNFLPAEQGEKFKVNMSDHGCGVAVADVDADGKDDVYLCNQLGPNALYRNRGDGTFEDVTQKAGVGLGDRVCVAAAWGDVDNDGLPDLYVTSTRGGNVLFHNEGGCRFKDVTKDAGVGLVAHSQTAAFFDYDGDGYLDLFVPNTAKWTGQAYDRDAHYYPGPADLWQMAASPVEHNVLYRNNHDGTFADVTQEAGLAGRGWASDVAAFDYNGDGLPDLYVTNMFGPDQLYRNRGDGTFREMTREVLGRTSWGATGARAFDANTDGLLDLFVVDMHSDMWMSSTIDPRSRPPGELRQKYAHVTGPAFDTDPRAPAMEERFKDLVKVRHDEVRFGNTLFRALAGGAFEEVSDRAWLETWWPWGIAAEDFDNDGHEDVFIPSGMGHPYAYWPNALMMNNGDGTFTDRAAELGVEPTPRGRYLDEPIGGALGARSSRSAAVADFDGDGRPDLVVNNFNDRPFYFRNHFPRQNHVAFRLTGTSYRRAGPGRKSSRDAVGALVHLHAGGTVLVRQVQAAGGYLSQSSQVLHFGLGERTKVDRVEVRWPGGAVQTLKNPAINTTHRLTEPSD